MCVSPQYVDEMYNSDSESTLESEADYDDENNSIIRAKWQMDGSKNLDECIEKLQNYIEYIKELKASGWELKHPVVDDYGFIRKSN